MRPWTAMLSVLAMSSVGTVQPVPSAWAGQPDYVTVCDSNGNCWTEQPSQAPATERPPSPSQNPPVTVPPPGTCTVTVFGPYFEWPNAGPGCQVYDQPYPYGDFVYQSFWAECCL